MVFFWFIKVFGGGGFLVGGGGVAKERDQQYGELPDAVFLSGSGWSTE